MPYAPKDASLETVRVDRDAKAQYDLDGRRPFVDANRGLIAPFPDKALGWDGRACGPQVDLVIP
ncbi:MAG: hypothetical protein ACJ74O_01310 [Frankiaceae bacterium]